MKAKNQWKIGIAERLLKVGRGKALRLSKKKTKNKKNTHEYSITNIQLNNKKKNSTLVTFKYH